LAQDDYYYEIQLTNKQLVFYFLAGATGLILSFLAGVMVGAASTRARGKYRPRAPGGRRARRHRGDAQARPPAAGDLTYAQRLESDKTDDGLEKARAGRPRRGPRAP
jgi:hypothetical protein